MALDRHKAMQSAERLLKQGKMPAALAQLEALADSASTDPITLNRVGDMLARHGQNALALKYYDRIASQFTQQGFYPKAVAIHKKILRINPNHIHSLIELGGLFAEQKLPGEARVFFLKGAELYLQTQDFTHAREVYAKLVAAEPDEPRHRARLAEALAAEGNTEAACDELLALGASLIDSQNAEDAGKAYRRARELMPGRIEPTLGVARALALAGEETEACELLRGEMQSEACDPAIRGELALVMVRAGRDDEALQLLEGEQGIDVPDLCFQDLLSHYLAEQTGDQFWERFDGVFRGWAEQGKPVRCARLYGHLAGIERSGHIPALTRLHELLDGRGDEAATVQALERLIQAHERHGDEESAASLREQLRELAPSSALCQRAETREVETPVEEPAADVLDEHTVAPTPEAGDETLPVEAEAPAVPLNRNDEEFVTGRLTQAEILDKYGLRDQALAQLHEIIEKFPGHVEAQQRLVGMLRDGPDPQALGDALIGLSLARRAAGSADGARQAAAEAVRIAKPDENTRGLLQKLGLLEPAGEPSVASADAEPATPKATAERSAPSASAGDDRAVLIDFDETDDEGDVEVGEEPPAAIPVPTAPPETEAPALSAAPAEAEAAATTDPPDVDAPLLAPFEPDSDSLMDSPADDDDDLSTITAALESEVFTENEERLSPEASQEQSLDDVFAAFRDHVEREVDSDDFRTHYDLGIAYKEMGLVDEAIGEFHTALKSADFARQASVMLAICHRERQELEEAVNWYRQALAAPGAGPDDASSLRYELAEMLLQTGDRDGALSLFRDLMQSDPSYRDVRNRVAELESATP
jgi:tetratricopeptide (TPR) repeat protein